MPVPHVHDDDGSLSRDQPGGLAHDAALAVYFGAHQSIGMNSRLDTIQAAVLIEKLKVFSQEIEWRNRIAARYNEGLRAHVAAVPEVPAGNVSNWAQYTIEHPDRDGLAAHLREQGVPTAVYYPIPLHLQKPYAELGHRRGDFAEAERIGDRQLSLPIYPEMPESAVDQVCEAIAAWSAR